MFVKFRLFDDTHSNLVFRRDKVLYKTEPIDNWAVVIFESKKFFNDDTSKAMVKGFIEGAKSVGKSLLVVALSVVKQIRSGIVVTNTNPTIHYANAHQGISKVCKSYMLYVSIN